MILLIKTLLSRVNALLRDLNNRGDGGGLHVLSDYWVEKRGLGGGGLSLQIKSRHAPEITTL